MSDLEMPVVCDCGETFSLEYSYPSRHDKTKLICVDCANKEDAEIEREEEISNLLEGLEEAQSNVVFYTEELKKLGVNV